MRLPVVIVACLIAVSAVGCGGAADHAAVGARPAVEDGPSASARRLAGWAAPAAARGGLPLSESFASGASLERWGYFEGDGGRNRFMVRGGRLDVVTPRSSWSGADRGFLLYRTVRGNFDVALRLRVAGRAGGQPRAQRAMAGLIVRAAPAGKGDPERWLSLNAGAIDGARVVDTVDTQKSESRGARIDGARGWQELRIRRRGTLFEVFVDTKYGWSQIGALIRADLPPTLQVGIDAFSGADRADLRAQVDWIRFR